MNRIRRYWRMMTIFIKRGGYVRAAYLKKIGYFKNQGEHCYFQPWNFGTDPHLISFGNNVHVGSKVTFINHDITALMFQYMDNNPTYKERRGEIIVGDNVFIGANSTVLYDVTIGSNVIIGADSLVCRDIPSGVIVGGNPCRVIGEYKTYKEKITGNKLNSNE